MTRQSVLENFQQGITIVYTIRENYHFSHWVNTNHKINNTMCVLNRAQYEYICRKKWIDHNNIITTR